MAERETSGGRASDGASSLDAQKPGPTPGSDDEGPEPETRRADGLDVRDLREGPPSSTTWGPTLLDDGPPEAVREIVAKMVLGPAPGSAEPTPGLSDLARALGNDDPPPTVRKSVAPPPVTYGSSTHDAMRTQRMAPHAAAASSPTYASLPAEAVKTQPRGQTNPADAPHAEANAHAQAAAAPNEKPANEKPANEKRDARFFAKDDERRWLDRYELISEIASGGMATVFLGRIVGAGGFQRLVAIKRLHGHLAEEPDFLRMFLEEGRLAAQIHHAHAVPILEIGSSERGYYLVMEYIEGVTLAQINARVSASGLPVPRRIGLRIMLDTLAGLHAAHELAGPDGRLLGLVHRDCSPHNILVGVDGAARITDFGVARDGSKLSQTRIGTLKGKVAYMAPEQIRQEARLDRRADLFAMGVVLWEVLAGQSLFRADTRFDTLVRALNAPVPRLSEVAYGIPEALDALCAKALARDPAERFQSAVEMAEAIEHGGSTIATPREVATFVRSLFGRELNERRAQIRAWLEEPSGADMPATTREAAVARASNAPPALEEEGAPSSKPDSVANTRQFVGSLDPIPFEEPVTIPMNRPSRGTRITLAVLASLVLVGGLAGFFARGHLVAFAARFGLHPFYDGAASGPKPRAPAEPFASTSASTAAAQPTAPPTASSAAPPATSASATSAASSSTPATSAAPPSTASSVASSSSPVTPAPTASPARVIKPPPNGPRPNGQSPWNRGSDELSNPYR